MAQGNQPIIIEENRNGTSIAIVALAAVLIVALLAVLAVMGAGYLFSTDNNVNNPPAATSQPAQPTQAPAPTDGSILPLGGFQLPDYVSVG